MNLFVGTGNLGKDPEMRYTPNGKAVTSFSMAINRKYTASSGERVQETEWVNCEAWGKLAEICNEYLRKGRKVLVVGRVKTDTYEKDGKKEHFRKVVLSEMEMLDNGDRSDQEEQEEETVAAPW